MGKMLHPSPIGMYQMFGYIINGSVLVINNSVLIQWGLFNQATSLGEYVSEGNFPISFTNTSYSALCIPACHASSPNENSWYWMFEYSTVSWCAFRTWSKDNTPSMKWIAIGY